MSERVLNACVALVVCVVVAGGLGAIYVRATGTPRSTVVCGADAGDRDLKPDNDVPAPCDCAAGVESLARDVQLALDRAELLRQRLDAVARSVPGRVAAPFVGPWPEEAAAP